METTITLGPVRFSYLNVFTPRAVQPGQEPKYSTAVLIPKTDKTSYQKIKAIVDSLRADVAAKNGGKLPSGFKNPLKDGDAQDADGNRIYDDNYKGMVFFNCSSKEQPTIVGKDRQPIADKTQIYSGMWGYINVNLYPYDNVGKGVGIGLNHIMKSKDDAPFSSRVTVADAFAGIDVAPEEDFDPFS